MTKIADILINETRKQMEFHKRNASGKASMSLREQPYDKGIRVMGVDYFENIFNGIPAGTNLTLSNLNEWAKKKQARYGVGVSSKFTLRMIKIGNAWINNKPEKLHIDTKVLVKKKEEINTEVKKYLDKKIRAWI